MNAKRNQTGQAVVELTVSLVGILVVFCGFLLISKLSIQNVHNIIDAREKADDNAINLKIVDTGDPILYWDKGSDNYMYTADDTSVKGVFANPLNFSDELKNDDFSLNSDLSMSYIHDNFAPRTLEGNFIFLNASGLTSGSSSSSVSLDDLERFLYVDTSSITLKDEIYMPLTSEN